MLIPRPALLLLLPQALTALTAPLNAGNAGDIALAERNKALFTVFTTPSHWVRYARYGTSPIKRSIEPDPPVPQSDHHYQHTTLVAPAQFAHVAAPVSMTALPASLFTTNLRTALGVAVVGTCAKTGREQRFLVHLPQQSGESEAWNDLVRAVKEARLRGVRVVVRVPDLGRDLPAGAEGAPWDWTEEDGRLAAMVRSEMQVLVRSNFGVAARMVQSPMGAVYRGERDAGTMEIAEVDGGATRVYVDGKVVP